MKNLIALISGLLFGIGLIISGMSNPKIVLGFLDIFNNWNYSLAFVMIGAVSFNIITFQFILRSKPKLGKKNHLPTKNSIDRNLILGSALFGVGWGILGICPGPAIVNLVVFPLNGGLFVLAMLIGMSIWKFIQNKFN